MESYNYLKNKQEITYSNYSHPNNFINGLFIRLVTKGPNLNQLQDIKNNSHI